MTPNGQIILITPNKNDLLKKNLLLEEYNNFFYDENSVNYFSISALKKILFLAKLRKFKIILEQGYSFINFVNWLNFKKPFFTGYVGEDRYVDKIIGHLSSTFKKKSRQNKINKSLISLLKLSSSNYKKICIKNKLANKLILRIYK